ncbi:MULTISPECIES: cytochrome P450 [Mumia]|uniref:cytochrome P450 n=1 Tax=Mumia TaxID=1546255 RepID=UPI001423F194|nr:cytochrome P450 [Mumia sp. ZJ430]
MAEQESVVETTFVVDTFEMAKEAYRCKDLRQSLYDEGEVVMADVLVNLHGLEHRTRRRAENRMFRRETFDYYEGELFPEVIEKTIAPYVEAGAVDLVHLGHELMLNLAALTAGVDRPEGTTEETQRLYDHMMLFVKGATLAHATGDKDAQRACVFEGLVQWDEEFLQPSVRRRAAILDQIAAGQASESDLPRDVLSVLLKDREELALSDEIIRREVAFFLLAGAHTSATAFVRSIDHILGWLEEHPEDRALLTSRAFVQRCIHETIRLNPSSPIGKRRALAPVSFKSGDEVPAGGTVVIDLMQVNRDVSVFGPDAAVFNPHRVLPPGVGPFGLSFAAGMHVCIGQDLAAGVLGNDPDASDGQLYGLVTSAVQRMFDAGVASDPDNPPQRDANTARPYWGVYPATFPVGA